jgi:hypothetical protein
MEMSPENWKWLLGYIFLGIVLIVFGRLLVKAFRKDKRSEWVKEVLATIEHEKTPREKRRQLIKDCAFGILIIAIWPIAFAVLVKELGKSKKHSPILSEPPPFKSTKEALLEVVNPLEIESGSMVLDPLGRVPQLPFGHLNPGWRKLRLQLRPGDVLWSFATPGYSSDRNRAEFSGPTNVVKGYAVIRNGEIVHEFFSEWA